MFDFKNFRPPTIPRFLCFNLVTGNLVIAWIHLIGCILVFISLIILLIFKDPQSIEVENVKIETLHEDPDSFTDTFHIVVKLIVLVVVVFIAFITYWFIHGIKTADPNKMKPYILLSAIYVIFAVISTLATLNFFVLVHAALEVYFFVAAYSLFYSFMGETSAQNLQQVIHSNPTAHGYSRAYESEYDDGDGGNYQQMDYGSYEMQQQQQGFEQHGGDQQQQQYYQTQQ